MSEQLVKFNFPDQQYFDYSSFLGDHVFAVVSKLGADTANFETTKKEQSESIPMLQIGNYYQKLAYPGQIHSDSVISTNTGGFIKNCDGIVTSSQEIAIRIKVADCVPVFLHDPKNKVNGLIHSGWRGTVKRITSKGISKFIELGSKVCNIKVVLGPSIKMRNYIVQEDVASNFSDHNKMQISEGWKIDLTGEIIDELTNIGIHHHHILSSDICSFESDECHSYRRDGEKAGRMYAFLGCA